MAKKVTFTPDDGTIRQLSDVERRRMLAVLDHLVSQPASRSSQSVDREIAEIRAARKAANRNRCV